MIPESWKPVVGFKGHYEISTLGRVRSLPRELIATSCNGKKYLKFFKGKLLRPGRKPSGHLSVALGRGNSNDLHVMVMAAFVGPVPKGQEVLHKDHNPGNNKLSNLKYGTRGENVKMDYEAKTRIPQRGILSGRAKYTEEQIKRVKWLSIEGGFGPKAISGIMCMPVSTVQQIVSGRRWGHI